MDMKTFLRKISSRKLWACVCGFVASLMALYNFSDDTVTRVTALITSAGCIAVYMLAEGKADSTNGRGEE